MSIKFQSQTLTIYNFTVTGNAPNQKLNSYNRTVLCNNYVDNREMKNIRLNGVSEVYSAYISINDIANYKDYHSFINMFDNSQYWTLRKADQSNKFFHDLIIIGDCDIIIDTTTNESALASINEIKTNYKTYIVSTFDEKFHGSKRMWHIEVGGK